MPRSRAGIEVPGEADVRLDGRVLGGVDAGDQGEMRAILRAADDGVGPGPLGQSGVREAEGAAPHRSRFRKGDGIDGVRVVAREVRFLAHRAPRLVGCPVARLRAERHGILRFIVCARTGRKTDHGSRPQLGQMTIPTPTGRTISTPQDSGIRRARLGSNRALRSGTHCQSRRSEAARRRVRGQP